MISGECLFDGENDSFDIIGYFVIPKTQNGIPPTGKIQITFVIIIPMIYVLAAIQLDNYFFPRGTKIHNIFSYGMLSAEMNI